MRSALFVSFLLSLAVTGVDAQSTRRPTAPPAGPVSSDTAPHTGLSNDDVIKLVKAGIAEQLIISSIRQAKMASFDTTADGIIRLKASRVSDLVIAVMLDPTAASGQPTHRGRH